MPSQALYRKWRSRTFGEVVAQEHVTRTLANALQSGRIAHAYLFTGPRGTGKTSTARLLAKAVNCTGPEGVRPCNQCPTCLAVEEGRLMDLIEIDAASNRGIDEIRDLREKVNFRPSEARFKVYVIDEVHMLTNEAFNALLKTLEEPPSHVIFVLATTEPHKIPATVASRCQRFDFRRIPAAAVVERLRHIARAEDIEVDDASLEFIARQSTGSLRDAVSLLDQLVAFGGAQISFERIQSVLGLVPRQMVQQLTDRLVAGDLGGALASISDAIEAGSDAFQFSREIVDYLRSLLLIKMSGELRLVNAPDEERKVMKAQAEALSLPRLVEWVKAFNQAGLDVRLGAHPQLPLELAVLSGLPPEVRPNAPAAVVVAQQAPAPVVTPDPIADSHPVRAAEPVPGPAETASDRRSGPAEGALTLEDVNLNWAAVKAEVQKLHRGTFSLLCEASPQAVVGDEVTIAFEHEPLHGLFLKDPERSVRLVKAMETVLGRPVRARCVVARGSSSVDARATQPAPSAAPPPTEPSTTPTADRYQQAANDQVVREAVRRYGAKVSDIRFSEDKDK